MKKISIIVILILVGCSKKDYIVEFSSLEEYEKYCLEEKCKISVIEEYSEKVENEILEVEYKEKTYTITVSKGSEKDEYKKYEVNDLGQVPIMMYHGIFDYSTDEYPNGNVDKDGYHRTVSAFKDDLEKYYNQGYYFVRLIDYINCDMKVPIGKSPMVLTFDDGLKNNAEMNDKFEFTKNSAIGIMEEFKKKYPDSNITATFFLNGGLFRQSEYNEKIIEKLIDSGYDIGNHSYSHLNLADTPKNFVEEEIGKQYELLLEYTDKYVNVVALPFGAPFNKDHENFNSILSANYNGNIYETISTLRVGWEPNYSCYDKRVDMQYLKRVRAYSNDGKDFDIAYTLELLKDKRYISSGRNDIIVTHNKEIEINSFDKKIVYYERSTNE